ncbi:MAG: outer membrane beta-barrel protein, partial [Alphaproteobacteria bacterium]|nr:outer membrane beta-barrel protein [Alphaproteobacteria bacterium]
MKKLILLSTAAAVSLATPAIAREKAWYIEADAGAVAFENSEITGAGTGSTLNTETGYDFGGIVGYDFGMFRLEAEASYRRAHVQDYTVLGTQFTGNMPGGSSALSGMVNGMFDFGPDDGLQAFVGGGVGVGRGKVQAFAPIGANINDSDTRFAYQALAGIRYPLNESVDFGLKYRFFNIDNLSLIDAAGTPVETRLRSHSLLATLAYNFGGAPA